MERSRFWLSSWSVQRLGGFIPSPKFKAQFSPHLGGCICWARNPELEVTDIWVGREGPIISAWGFILLQKKFLLCPSCILLLSPPLCYQVPLPSPAPRFQRSRLICTCTSLPLAEPTSLKERHPTHPVPHPRAAVAPGDLVSTFHKTSQILLAFQL